MAKGFIDKEESNDNAKEFVKGEVDYEQYFSFIKSVTSKASGNYTDYVARLNELNASKVDVSRLTTAAIGISAEAGEFAEIVKKILFQGKPFNEDNKHHMIVELGDIVWYIVQACIALDVSLDEVVFYNVEKLLKRYPEGVFDVFKSENRQEGDI